MFRGKEGVYIIGEIGGNHEGDFDTAMALLHDAAGAGVHAIKYQVYTGNTLVNVREDPERVKHFNKFALTTENYLDLAREARRIGVEFLASIWDETQVDVFNDYLAFYKIGSGDLTAYPLLRKIAMTGKPIVLSTGLATMEEIGRSIAYICNINPVYNDKKMLALLQCTSMYPIPNKDANLKSMVSIREKFHYPIGYSDHTEGTYAAELAVALGAEIIEVHFTDRKEGRSFRDHKVSFNHNDIKTLKERISVILDLLGDGVKKPMNSEIKSGHVHSFRRALYPKHDICKGTKVDYDDFITLRPNVGISADQIEDVVGRVAKKDLLEYQRLSVEDFE